MKPILKQLKADDKDMSEMVNMANRRNVWVMAWCNPDLDILTQNLRKHQNKSLFFKDWFLKQLALFAHLCKKIKILTRCTRQFLRHGPTCNVVSCSRKPVCKETRCENIGRT